ncbi:DNA alkylation repair protein [Hydrogenophaga sp. NFH-34]|uniref:DNA alkylation repair protein n=1 Tax=Hydrogenophaga sp. NFH-34 TaxID=2744446 RepID=UPI001F45305B|nr:DNA alkylation repair protein [Hydrogenophaga sp. NFH-34]
MAEPFKNLINAGTVQQAGAHLQRAWPAFDRHHFERLALDGLDALEFKARAMQLADALGATLPAPFAAAADVLEASLAPPIAIDAEGEPTGLSNAQSALGISGWTVWAMGEYVARHGQHDLARALACLHALTQRFSAEFAIRPFLRDQPAAVLATLAQWQHDPSAHVRRLVSEGSRPRLPWGLRLQALVADPSPTLPLLLALQDDPSSYVRRSVANHLNDIAKDHPDLIADWVVRYRRGASAQREALLRHASRGLVKQGHAPTLAAWGLAQGLAGSATLSLDASQARIGEDIGLQVALHSRAPSAQALVIDYAVHHRKANGRSAPKVFKGWKLTLAPGEQRALAKRHSLRPVTTRTLYPGEHRIELQINGQVVAEAAFELLPA